MFLVDRSRLHVARTLHGLLQSNAVVLVVSKCWMSDAEVVHKGRSADYALG